MNQELVAAQPCSPFSVVRDVVDDITFGDDAIFKLDGFCLFRVFIYPKPVRTPYEESFVLFFLIQLTKEIWGHTCTQVCRSGSTR